MKTPTYTELLRERDAYLELLETHEIVATDTADAFAIAVSRSRRRRLLHELREHLVVVLGTDRANDPPQIDDLWRAFERLDDVV